MLSDLINTSQTASDSGISCATSGFSTPLPVEIDSFGYTYEPLGLLIYDSQARTEIETIETEELSQRRISPCDRKELETVSDSDRDQYLSAPLYPPSKPRKCTYTLCRPSNCLAFSSHFEGGNLRKVVKVSEYEYHLTLDFDVNTEGHTQWYFFEVQGMKAGQLVKFCIVNLTKAESLYQMGMQPLVRSDRKEEAEGVGWHRAGWSVQYAPNPNLRLDKPLPFRTLSFEYRFEYAQDRVYFAHCYPYTYADLRQDLGLFESSAPFDSYRSETLCYTSSGNICPLLTITNQVSDTPLWTIEEGFSPHHSRFSRKKTVILTSRVHPGESNSSYMLRGAVAFLLSSEEEAQALRQNFVFRVVPMLNPDGVRYGNTRCDLFGIDLNRRWICPNRLMQPTLYYVKKMMKAVEGDIALFCDLHGHSAKKNAFIYACNDPDPRRNTSIQLFPLLFSRLNPLFSFTDCQFRIDKKKESTARVVCFREFNICSSYTLEASFFGPSEPCDSLYMATTHYESLGKDLVKTLLTVPGLRKGKPKAGEIAFTGRASLSDNAELKGIAIELALEDAPAPDIYQPRTDRNSEGETKQIAIKISPSPVKIKVRKRPQTSKSRHFHASLRPANPRSLEPACSPPPRPLSRFSLLLKSRQDVRSIASHSESTTVRRSLLPIRPKSPCPTRPMRQMRGWPASRVRSPNKSTNA